MYYDIEKNLEDNVSHYHSWPTCDYRNRWPSSSSWQNFLGYRLAVPIGVAACPITLGEGIRHLAAYGYGILTYKTIRATPFPAHPMPNIAYLNISDAIESGEDEIVLEATTSKHEKRQRFGLANSFGNACFSENWIRADLIKTKHVLQPGQLLNVSIYGEETQETSAKENFVKAAIIAKGSGAHLIEMNLSCPNLKTKMLGGALEEVSDMIRHVVDAVKPLPVIVKIGYLADKKRLQVLLNMFAKAKASAVSAMNTMPARILSPDSRYVFGEDRKISGVSGFPIQKLALSFIEMIADINQQDKLDLAILGMGGVVTADDFLALQKAGADVALAATAVMQDLFIIRKFKQ